MTVDLWMLVYSAILCAVIPFAGVTGLMLLPGGLAWGFSNRDSTFQVPDWILRTRRAHANLVENLVHFAVLVLVAHVAAKADGATAFGAQIFFVARVAHAAVYIIGIPYLRTLVFAAGIFGEMQILLRIFA